MNRACLHLNRSAQSARCFLWGIKAFWVWDFFLFLVAVPRLTHTAMLALNRKINWMVNNDDCFALWFAQVNDQKNICKMGMSNYILQHGFNKKTKGREISTILKCRWTGLCEYVKHKKNWLVYMLCRQSTKPFLVKSLTLCSARAVNPRLSARAQSPQLHLDTVIVGCWPRAASCRTNPGSPRPSRFSPVFACPAVAAGLWHPSLITPESCLPALPEAAAAAPKSFPDRSWKTGSTSASRAQHSHCQHELKAAII